MNRTTVAAFALAFILLFGCVSDWKTVAKPLNTTVAKPASKPAGIYIFSMSGGYFGGGDYFTGSLAIEDQYGKTMAAPGTLSVSIEDSKGVKLYDSSFHLYASDYNATSSSYGLFNSTTYSYGWKIPYGAVNKSASASTSGSAYVSFMPDGGGSAMNDSDPWVTLPDSLVGLLASTANASSTVGEGNTATVSCMNGSVISNYTSIYGTNCPSSGGIKCGRCIIGASSCTVVFSNANCAGDPCYGTVKKGTLSLVCVPK
jgi:hypothetical protein